MTAPWSSGPVRVWTASPPRPSTTGWDVALALAERAVVNGMGEFTYISNAGLRVMPQTIRKTQERGAIDTLALCSLSERRPGGVRDRRF